MRIGIMGGSFDPIHQGHLVLAEQVREACGLDQVIFVPTGIPPHKTHRQLTGEKHRFAMVQLAISGNPHFGLSDIEMHADGPCYTVDTLTRLMADGAPDTTYFYLTGADAIMELRKWRRYDELLGLCTFLGATRPGTETAALKAEVAALNAEFGSRVRLVEISPLDISSTAIRRRLAEKRSIRYLVPEAVRLYIETHGLYDGIGGDEC